MTKSEAMDLLEKAMHARQETRYRLERTREDTEGVRRMLLERETRLAQDTSAWAAADAAFESARLVAAQAAGSDTPPLPGEPEVLP